MTEINITVCGEIDHTKVVAPFVRIVKTVRSTYLLDVRFCQPNKEVMDTECLHTVEHLVAVELEREFPDTFVNFGPLGCRTGYYMSFNTLPEFFADRFEKALRRAASHTSVPLETIKECGYASHHDLKAAKIAINKFLESKDKWAEVYASK